MDKSGYIQIYQYFKDIYEPPEFRLPSGHPIWSAMPSSDCSVDDARIEDWFKHGVPNQFLITDLTIRQPGFDLNRHDWTILNRYRTGHGRCAAALYDWGIRDDPFCAFGDKQTMSHIINECPLTKFPGGIQAFHTADEDAVKWFHKFSIR